jgi:predicted site-specific integrase-resolvase
MALVSKAKAAKLAGVSRTTIHRYTKEGKLSMTGAKIDTSELIRVFGEIKDDNGQSEQVTEQPKVDRSVTSAERQALNDQIALLTKQLEKAERLNDETRKELSEANKLIRDTHKPRSLIEWIKG